MISKVKSAAKAPDMGRRAPIRAAKPEKRGAKEGSKKGAEAGVGRETRTTTGQKASTTKTKKVVTARAAKESVQAAKPVPNSSPLAAAAVRKAKARAKTKEPARPAKQGVVKAAGAKRPKKKAAPMKKPRDHRIGEAVVDPIGDTTDGEGRTYLGAAEILTEAVRTKAEVDAFRRETRLEASDVILEAGPGMEAAQQAMEARARSEAVETVAGDRDAGEMLGEQARMPESGASPRAVGESAFQEPAKLERLQKILSQAGIASRRRAEEMITEGRVAVNGKVVTTLGSKADPERDHIRVDGKLLHGAERHRYFLLNKPRGYVTTVSDPEGRPTVMKFFEKLHERLYPVGRLDFQSEGLLLVTNDGELANLLTKAGSGVEKTYLVKVAGRPTEQELEKLRSGVMIERAEEGSGHLRTAPARVRQVRVGDNPWFEVVLTEGRNRELRKMFAAVGHFVEKIRRVGYGPLALDVEPGKMRELTPDEVKVLRLTAEGKMKPKRLHADRMLPKDAGRTTEEREERRGRRSGREFGRGGREEFGQRKSPGQFDQRTRSGIDRREGRNYAKREDGGYRRREGAEYGKRSADGFAARDNKPFRPRDGEFRGAREGAGQGNERERFGGAARRERGNGERKPFRAHGERPYWKRGGAPKRQFDGAAGKRFEKSDGGTRGARPEGRRNDGERGPRQGSPEFRGKSGSFGGRKPGFGGRPGGIGGPRREGGRGGSRPGGGRGFGGRKRG